MPLPEPEIIAGPVRPEAAIAFWAWKIPMPYSEAAKLAGAARDRAFYVAGLEESALVKKVYDGIGEALKNGETLPDFKKRQSVYLKIYSICNYRKGILIVGVKKDAALDGSSSF
jgi:hypothetical protein